MSLQRAKSVWNVSPPVDTLVYHFGWLWMLLPLVCLYKHHNIFVGLYLFVMVVNFIHLHFGLPYAYLDREIFQMHSRRLTVVPGLCVLAFAGMAFLPSPWMPYFQGVAFAALMWNIWHVFMQKYGIMRVYNAKWGNPPERQVPGWVDRQFIFGWIPLYAVYLMPKYRDIIEANGPSVKLYLLPMVDAFAQVQWFMLIPAVSFLLYTIATFLRHEWLAHRFQNRARLSMAIGMTGLSSAFVLTNPVLAYMAFGFGHGIEYVVFVSAFQKRRYGMAGMQGTPMAWVVSHARIVYPAFMVLLGATYLLATVWGINHKLDGYSLSSWLFFWVVYESMIHFYTDGFLWKVRKPIVRQSL